MKFGSLFTGGGGFDIGATAAGLTPAWGVEYIPEIAAHANSQLGEHIICADILELDPAAFEPVDWLHASPPCPSFSVANSNKGETKQDIALGRATADFIRALRPRYFSMENVYGYRNSQSWGEIVAALHDCGYGFIVEHINSADFGVPQKRRRMIVRAVRDKFFIPPFLMETHGRLGSLPWVGWWEAVEDIADTFPHSWLVPWQKSRLGDRLDKVLYSDMPIMVEGVSAGQRPPTLRKWNEPSISVSAGSGGRLNRICWRGNVRGIPPRALARFQTFPDSYVLPAKKTLAVTIIGNAVPCLLARRIVESLI